MAPPDELFSHHYPDIWDMRYSSRSVTQADEDQPSIGAVRGLSACLI